MLSTRFTRNLRARANIIEQGRVDIEGEATAEVSTQWVNVIEGEHEIHILVEYPRGFK
jgi:hypothetical protein